MAAIGVAIAGAFTAFKATALGVFLTQNFFGRLLASVALSALQVALAPKPKSSGITTDVTQTGGTNPMSFILGRYATAGSHVCPPMSHGTSGKTPNAYLTYVINLGDVAGQTLSRVIIDGNYVTLGSPAHADYGLPVTGIYTDYAWVKYYDGTQTSADAGLLAKYASYPERPWLADMIGRNTCYAIVTFRYNREKFGGFPKVLFEMDGIPLYDPRKDSTVGGSGAHLWSTPSTWEPTNNLAVMIYNAKRGISLPDLGIWGGEMPAEDLPFASWVSAMNSCDMAVPLSVGGTEPAYRGGYEVTVSTEPSAVIEELLKACAGQVAEAGGIWKIRVGGPSLPVYFLTDDDVIVTRSQDLDPFPAGDQRNNGIAASYPEPDSIWESKSAPPRYNATWEAEDGGRRSVASLQLPAAPYANQVQRLMQFYAADDRRHLRHTMTLPPDAAVLEPLDTFSWTSARNGYTAKLFDVSQLVDDQVLILQTVASREVNAGDVAWSPSDELAYFLPSPAPVLPPAQTVSGFSVVAHTITDDGGTSRRPAIRLIWDGADQDGVRGLEYEVRVAATSVVIDSGTLTNITAGEYIVSTGILAGVGYEARMMQIADWNTVWTAWGTATAPTLLIDTVDLELSAVTKRSSIYFPSSSTYFVTGTDIAGALQLGDIGLFSIAPYIYSGSGVENPVRMRGRFDGDAGPIFSTFIILGLQRRAVGATPWTFVGSFRVKSGDPVAISQLELPIAPWGFSTTPQEFRIAAYLDTQTSCPRLPVRVWDFEFTLEQISR